MPAYEQTNRPLKVATTLGEDKFLLASVKGREAVSRPYEFRLELRSEDPAIDGSTLLRTPVAVEIQTDEESPRYIHGVIRRFLQLGRRDDLFGYDVEIVPWFWLLSLSQDCRIFQNLNVLEIVQQVFQDLGFKPTDNFRLACTKSYAKREYCVQYRETHMDFVSRLLEEEGIFYFFEHTSGKHVMVLADGNGAVPICPGSPRARMAQDVQATTLDMVTSLAREDAVHTAKVTLKDYDYLQPALTLEGSIAGTGVEELYDYPGRFTTIDEGDRLARLQLEAEEALQQVVRGDSSCRGLQAGTRFDLENHFRSAMNQNYLVLELELETSAENFRGWEEGTPFEYRNTFLAIPNKTPYRPRRSTARPLVAGTQTALVVGPAGEEVWVDKHGRVKVQFYWDRRGKKDDKSSCWVRVSTMWAGKGWGSVSIPRIGNEVVVDFLEGDPDRPLIVGSVYNADQTPPFTLPGAGIQMGMKSRTSKGGGGMNEITMTDTKSKELINIHAQYDMKTMVLHDQSDTVVNDRHITVTGKHTESIKKDTSITITEGNFTQDVLKGHATVTVKKGVSLRSVDEGMSEVAKKTVSIVSETQAIHLTAETEIKLLVGSSSITMKKDGTITIAGKNISILADQELKASGQKLAASAQQEAKLGVSNQQVTCDNMKVNVSGAQISAAAVGIHEITGALVKIN